MKHFIRFVKKYPQFGLTAVSIVIALPLDISGIHTAAHVVLGLSAIINVIPLIWSMVQDLRVGKYGVDILAATAIITSVILGQFWAGIIIVLMLTGGEALEDYAEQRARTELDALLTHAPKKAHVLRGRKTLDVTVSDVRVNDKVIIRPGETIPVDAIIIEGSASFDESSLTGESLPVTKKAGDNLLSGSINLDGLITAKALRVAADSQYEQIVQLVKSAASSKSPFVRLADRYSIPFTLVAFGIGIAAWVLSGQSVRFLEVLVVATPCPLILAAPIALISGMSRAAKYGIIIKTGSGLEQLAVIQTVGFDKTGTLTKGELQVDTIKTFNSFSTEEVLSLAASLERNSTHVLAQAIVTTATSKKLKITKSKNQQELAGNGVSAYVKGKHVLVGRFSLINDYSVKLPRDFKLSSIQTTTAFVVIDRKLAGLISFKDEIRPESKRTLKRLRKLGIQHLLMVTGDNTATAKTIAKQLGITEVYAETLPADKLRIIEQVSPRPVAFVGDGVNDAPVLTAADVGIALGARNSTAASESADVVIMLDNIERVATGVAIAKRTFFIAKQSIWIGIAISVGLMFIFSTGKFRPVYGAAIQEVVDIIVIFNALRAHDSWRTGSLSKSKPSVTI